MADKFKPVRCSDCGDIFTPFQVGNSMLGIRDRCEACTKAFYGAEKVRRSRGKDA